MTEPLVVEMHTALGDHVCLTAAVRDLALAHPGRWDVRVDGHYRAVWADHPHARVLAEPAPRSARRVVMDCRPGIAQSQAGGKLHYLSWYHRQLGRELGVHVPVTRAGGLLALPRTRAGRAAEGRYWVVVAGGKWDMTTKWWPPGRWQAVVDALAARGVRCVQAGADFGKETHPHTHPRLAGVTSALGATADVRDLFRLIRDADGVLCGVTAAMHVAAAFDRPCVVVAGGREERHWEAYTDEGQFGPGVRPAVPHVFLDRVGALDCCRDRGCWRRTVLPFRPEHLGDPYDLCAAPTAEGGSHYAGCMTDVTPDQVVAGVLSYYEAGVLPPPDPAPPRLLLPAAASEPNPAPVFLPPDAPAVPLPLLPAAPPPGLPAAGVREYLDHPLVGGRLTVFVLCWGPHPELARRCLGSVLGSVPPGRLDLRVGLNQVCPETAAYVKALPGVTKAYPDAGGRRKYPAMRQMLNDPACPVTTPVVVWFDDDTVVVDPHWAEKLAQRVAAAHPGGARAWGTPLRHDLPPRTPSGADPLGWFKAAPWWRGRPLAGRDGRPDPAGRSAVFPVGYFWAADAEFLRAADAPDPRLDHNGDACLGFQLAQLGFSLDPFNLGKSLVWCPPRDAGGRRNHAANKPFPWLE